MTITGYCNADGMGRRKVIATRQRGSVLATGQLTGARVIRIVLVMAIGIDGKKRSGKNQK